MQYIYLAGTLFFAFIGLAFAIANIQTDIYELTVGFDDKSMLNGFSVIMGTLMIGIGFGAFLTLYLIQRNQDHQGQTGKGIEEFDI